MCRKQVVIVLLPKLPTTLKKKKKKKGYDRARPQTSPLSAILGLWPRARARVLGTRIVGIGSYPGHWVGERLGIDPKSSRLGMQS